MDSHSIYCRHYNIVCSISWSFIVSLQQKTIKIKGKMLKLRAHPLQRVACVIEGRPMSLAEQRGVIKGGGCIFPTINISLTISTYKRGRVLIGRKLDFNYIVQIPKLSFFLTSKNSSLIIKHIQNHSLHIEEKEQNVYILLYSIHLPN